MVNLLDMAFMLEYLYILFDSGGCDVSRQSNGRKERHHDKIILINCKAGEKIAY